jgi:hypothetical protein
MSDKRRLETSSVLPLTLVYEPEHRNLVKQHWNVTFARQAKISVVAKRIMARVLDQIRDDDFKLREYYQLPVAEISDSAGVSRENIYREVEAALRELATTSWEFKDVEEEKWHIRHLLDTTKEQTVGYQNGIITVLLNPQLTPYFIQIAHYTTYRVDSYMKLRSWYSMRFYEILAAFRDTGFWEVGLDEYRQLLDCSYQTDKRGRILKNKQGEPRLKYPNVNDLISYTTTEPLSELAETELAFRVQLRHETGRTGRGRPKIVGLRFELLEPLPLVIPPAWHTHPVTGPIIEKLRGWKVSDKNIAKYATVLQRQGIAKLIREWELKEVSSRRIDSREKYCNTAFVRAAKAIMDEQKAEALQVKQELQLGLFNRE